MAKQMTPLPDGKSVRVNPSPQELRELAARMPNARETRYGNLNVQTEVLARSKASTFLLLDDPESSSQQAISREEGDRIAQLQDDYIAGRDMLVVDGFIGDDPDFRTPARLYIEESNANIAGMQKQLYFEVDDRDGLPLHAGCKVIPTDSGDRVGLIVGLSGTGKTTTTFTRQNGSLPVQDDFVAWMPNGRVYATENGCFAKTFGLNPEDEPTIYAAVTQPDSYLENVSQHGDEVDFYDTNYTSNGRATFPFGVIEAASADEIDEAHFLLILNKNENIVPAVAKLEGPQAAAFFMLGETTGTSAGGADEAGKFMRVPGTNPFFPMLHDLQGNRFLEL